MSDQQQSVWPDGAREAVTDALRRDSVLGGMVPLEDQLLTALEPFVQQRIETALSDIDEMVPPAIGIYQTIPDRVRLVIAQRDEAAEDVRLYREEADRLRAEVARLREDGERLDRLAEHSTEGTIWIRAVTLDGEYGYQVGSGILERAFNGNLRVALDDAARSARGGEG